MMDIEGICIENPMEIRAGGALPSIIPISATTEPFHKKLDKKSIATYRLKAIPALLTGWN